MNAIIAKLIAVAAWRFANAVQPSSPNAGDGHDQVQEFAVTPTSRHQSGIIESIRDEHEEKS